MLALLTIFLLMQGPSNSKFPAMLGFLRDYSQYGSNASKDLSLLSNLLVLFVHSRL